MRSSKSSARALVDTAAGEALLAEQKAKRDARYAARKAAKKNKKRGY